MCHSVVEGLRTREQNWAYAVSEVVRCSRIWHMAPWFRSQEARDKTKGSVSCQDVRQVLGGACCHGKGTRGVGEGEGEG